MINEYGKATNCKKKKLSDVCSVMCKTICLILIKIVINNFDDKNAK